MNWMEELANSKDHLSETLSFDEYMEEVGKQPQAHLRPTCTYLADMFEHFGKSERGAYNLFLTEHPDYPPVYGQIETQEAIYQNLKNFEEEGFNNKFILLVGPNGSSKSSLIRKIMNGAEDYSKTAEGALYSFSWIFPVESHIKGSLGLHADNIGKTYNTYANLEENEISAILTSDLKDHPVLLIPPQAREKIIEDYLHDHPQLLGTVKKSYLYNGDVSKRNRMIYDALLKSYKGDHAQVLKHIRVERFDISKRYSTGAVTIEPQLHVDAKMQQITMDKRLASLPPSLQSLNLFSMHGEVVLANRGVLEFSDLLKRPLDTFKYLLMTMESKTVNLQGILTELDIFFIGSSNEIHLSAFKQHPDYNSFKGRFNFIRVPYLLNYEDESKIYQNQIKNIEDKTHFEPHSIDALCLFSVMTRLRPSQLKNFKDKTLAKITTNLSPFEKALLYTKGKIPSRLDSEESKVLRLNIGPISDEFKNENLYEGKFGISPREIKMIIYEVSNSYNNVTYMEIFEYLATFIERKNEHDFLNIAAQGEYNNPVRFIDSLKNYFLDLFDSEVRDCLGLVDRRSYEEYIAKYILHINAMLKNEKVINPITGKNEPCNTHLIEEFESSINLKEDASRFRSHMISTLGAYSLDNPGSRLVYTEVFPDVVKRLKESFRDEQKKVIQKISQNLIFYIAESSEQEEGKKMGSGLDPKNKKSIDELIDKLKEQYGYSQKGTLTLLKHLINSRY